MDALIGYFIPHIMTQAGNFRSPPEALLTLFQGLLCLPLLGNVLYDAQYSCALVGVAKVGLRNFSNMAYLTIGSHHPVFAIVSRTLRDGIGVYSFHSRPVALVHQQKVTGAGIVADQQLVHRQAADARIFFRGKSVPVCLDIPHEMPQTGDLGSLAKQGLTVPQVLLSQFALGDVLQYANAADLSARFILDSLSEFVDMAHLAIGSEQSVLNLVDFR